MTADHTNSDTTTAATVAGASVDMTDNTATATATAVEPNNSTALDTTCDDSEEDNDVVIVNNPTIIATGYRRSTWSGEVDE